MDAIKTVITSIVPMSDEEYNLMLPVITKREVKKIQTFCNKAKSVVIFTLSKAVFSECFMSIIRETKSTADLPNQMIFWLISLVLLLKEKPNTIAERWKIRK